MSTNYNVDDVLARNNDFLLNSTVYAPQEWQGNMATQNRIISPCDVLKEQCRKIAEQNAKKLFSVKANNMSLS